MTTRQIMAVIGFIVSFFISLGVSRLPEEMGAGDSLHSEIFRLREDARGIRNVLIVGNGLLAAIVAALLF